MAIFHCYVSSPEGNSNMLQLHVGHTHGRGTCTRTLARNRSGKKYGQSCWEDRSASFYDQCITEVVTHLKTTESQLYQSFAMKIVSLGNQLRVSKN